MAVAGVEPVVAAALLSEKMVAIVFTVALAVVALEALLPQQPLLGGYQRLAGLVERGVGVTHQAMCQRVVARPAAAAADV